MSGVRRHPFLLLWLTAVWVGLWGSFTAANLLGGLAVAAAVLALPLPLSGSAVGAAGESGRATVRPLALLRFVAFFGYDLVRASLQVAALVLRPRARLRQAVVAVPVAGASDALLTLLANAISLTPGTLTLEVDRQRAILYVHVLQVGHGPGAVEQVRQSVVALQRLAVRAVGGTAAREALPRGAAR